MTSSPYLPQDVKQYIRKYQLQKVINQSLNSLLKLTPDDPYSYLIGYFNQLATPQIEINTIKALEVITADGFPAIKIHATCTYNNQPIALWLPHPLGIVSEEGMIFDEDRLAGKGHNKGIAYLENHLSPKISGSRCSEQSKIDACLIRQLTANNNLGVYQVNSVSYMPSIIQSLLLSKPLYQIYGEMTDIKEKGINVVVNCLQGGKAIGSKCKMFKYLLIFNHVKDPSLVQTVTQAVRKSIVGGKAGEAGLKLSPDGTFICPLDTIMDNLKILEDAINTTNSKDYCSIGLSWMAETLYSTATKKYQLENPKTPFDNDQMIDYLVKLLTDKPLIQYLEDPLDPSEKASWKKLITKIKSTDQLKNVKIGSRNGRIFNLSDPNIKEQISQLSIDMTQQTHPDLTQQSRKTANLNKFKLDFIQLRAFDLKTLSKLINIKKQFNKTKTNLIIQDNSYQTYDTTLVDLAYGTNSYLNLGSINKYDRICKLNRIAQIIALTK